MELGQESPQAFPPVSLSQADLTLGSAPNVVKALDGRVIVPASLVEGGRGCWLPSELSFFAQDGVPGL